MKIVYCVLLSFLVFENSFANTKFLECIKNEENPKTKTLLIFYRSDCPYCQKMDKTSNRFLFYPITLCLH